MYYKDGNIFDSQYAIRKDNKDTSLPTIMTEEFIANLGYLQIVDGAKPTPSTTQTVQEDFIELIDGVPVQQYKLVDMFSDTAEYVDTDGTTIPAKTKEEYEAEYIAKVASDAKQNTLNQANSAYEAQVLALTAGVPESEKLTWTKQEDEARAWTIDNTANTPLLDAIVSARGIDKATLVDKVIVKADLYAQAIGTLTGQRQAIEDSLV